MTSATAQFGLTIEEWKNATAALASVVTAVGIAVGAVWAWRRFRRTPESRAKIDIDLSATWRQVIDAGPVYLDAKVTVENRGGRDQMLRVADASKRPSRIACWSFVPDNASDEVTRDGYVNWSHISAPAAQILIKDRVLRPTDKWDESILFVLPAGAAAARLVVYVYVEQRRSWKDRLLRRKTDEELAEGISASIVVLQPAKEA